MVFQIGLLLSKLFRCGRQRDLIAIRGMIGFAADWFKDIDVKMILFYSRLTELLVYGKSVLSTGVWANRNTNRQKGTPAPLHWEAWTIPSAVCQRSSVHPEKMDKRLSITGRNECPLSKNAVNDGALL
ncbi:hypothetical protein CEXT_647041 [Caerostris extrusa]|uniref:Uncharacterized protein n=1 Tax=Caerostris extrusa TaxID=172846 RepID=A0AAV4VPD7_CAEEX|nr:hypothetical protein CEXT_647041 [Caerostris extrusa]